MPSLPAPHDIPRITALRYPRAKTLNDPLALAFAGLDDTDFTHRSHYIDGRFENLYLDRERLPGLDDLLRFATAAAAARLGLECPPLRCGFWLNAMPPGSSTSRHSHEENDELLAGVYYVAVPEASGDVVFADDPFAIRVTPRPGQLLLFPPALPHWVEPHRGEGLRLSVALNFGPKNA
ncbi:MAG: 2OG-Fe(II) oxygenase family protein [Thiohalocapsa sp.]|jgi:uncharacterized RmlC-like cupin family protein|uniref:putative 2OG-Fe(II) oxygenase n=1 Tax=Thiohalocapsa sp. TaxID=2497641 RepID=UPI0025E5ED21|nr:putative 2OG-Fe(II) oxygenase [Thiohalocapsa sp.]MCG6942002.1 2OG-Fe(II) oxygenase family protein [Thiohalocapsa sp.]